MRTDELLDVLAEDASVPWRLGTRLALAVIAGTILAASLLVVVIGVRPDAGTAMSSLRFVFKFVVTLALAVTATRSVIRLARPDAPSSRGLGLVLAPALLGCAVGLELWSLPVGCWLPSLVGHNARYCLSLIPLLALGPLACLLAALRQGAPTRPGLTGGVAGLAAAGIAATFYASHCDDDSPLFVLLWYSLAVLIVSAAGYLAGRKVLAW
jgi:hypothetical protein